MTYIVKNQLFGTDGIRGLAGEGFLTIESLDKMIGSVLFCIPDVKYVVIGQDTRLSGEMLSNIVSAIFSSYGVNVTNLGIATTPSIAFLTKKYEFDLGIVISASHNSFEDNGIKFFDNNGCKFTSDLEEKITSAFFAGKTISKKTHKQIGVLSRRNLLKKYEDYVLQKFSINLSKIKIVVDCANGAMYKVARSIFKKLKGDITYIFNKPNGININENCGAVYPKILCDTVLKKNADIGFAFDGDGDRLVVCDENGEVIDGDHLLGFLGEMACSPSESKNIIISEMSNLGLENYLTNIGYSVIRTPVGDKYISEKIYRKESLFGGENSGHIILGKYQETGDGLIAALKILELMQNRNDSISKLARDFTLLPSVKINVQVEDKDKISSTALKKISEKFESENTRILLRKSGTENLIRILIEGDNYDDIAKIADKMKEEITYLDK